MYKYILEKAGEINWMALFALVTFFTIFMLSIYLVLVKDKKKLEHMENLPLEEDDPEIIHDKTTHQ